MKNKKTWIFFINILVFTFFSGITQVNSQETYNYFALQDLKQSLEYLIHGDYDNAILSCSRVLVRDPRSSVTYTIRARAYYEKGEIDRAIADCNTAINLDRNNVSAYSIRGNAYAKKGDLQNAVVNWQEVLRLSPENPEAIRNLEIAGHTQ